MGRAAARLSFAALAAATLVPLTVGRASADVPVVVIDGRGWGHGVGMAQDGALEMGRKGFGLSQILGQFYPGTTFGHAGGDVRVAVLDAGAAPATETVTFPDGGQVVDTLTGAQSPGFPRPVPPGGTAVISWDGSRYTVATSPVQRVGAAGLTVPILDTTTTRPLVPLTTPTTARPSTTTTRPPRASTTTSPAPSPGPAPPPAEPLTTSRPVWALPQGGGALGVPARGREYRGDLEATGGTGHLRLVNQLDVETYLTGMGEVLNPSWPAASLETQEVAARTYALRAMATGGELCDDARCQVYLGTAGEYTAAEQAVGATRGLVLLTGGQLADAVYSANAGGFSASQEEGFGTSDDAPYLRPAPYPTGDTMPWSVSVATSDAGRLLGLPGPVTSLSVTSTGPSGRALTINAASGSTTVAVSGLAFASVLDLRSTLISVHMSQAATAPPPPSGPPQLQVPPDQAAIPSAILRPQGRPDAMPSVRRPTRRSEGRWVLVGLAGALAVLTGAGAARQTRHRRGLVTPGSGSASG